MTDYEITAAERRNGRLGEACAWMWIGTLIISPLLLFAGYFDAAVLTFMVSFPILLARFVFTMRDGETELEHYRKMDEMYGVP